MKLLMLFFKGVCRFTVGIYFLRAILLLKQYNLTDLFYPIIFYIFIVMTGGALLTFTRGLKMDFNLALILENIECRYLHGIVLGFWSVVYVTSCCSSCFSGEWNLILCSGWKLHFKSSWWMDADAFLNPQRVLTSLQKKNMCNYVTSGGCAIITSLVAFGGL